MAYSDDFERADSSSLGSPWVELLSTGGDISISSGALVVNVNNHNHAKYGTAVGGSGKYYSEIVKTAKGGGSFMGPSVSYDAGTTGSCYVFFWTGTVWRIRYYTGKTTPSTVVADASGTEPSTPYTMRLEFDPSTGDLEGFVNGASVVSGNNGSISTRYSGVFLYGTAVAAGSWEAGEVSVSVDITPADATHSHGADSPAITQAHAVIVAEATHQHVADATTITQTHAVSANEAVHAHTADAAGLTQTHVVASAESLHAHTADNTTATVGGVTISANAADHDHAVASPVVTQTHVVSAAGASHAHAADGAPLTVSASVSVASSDHAHAADSPIVTQAHVVTAAAALHSHSADEVFLYFSFPPLAVDATFHAHSSDSPTITQTNVVVVADASHAHAADAPVLTQTVYVLAVFTHTLHGAKSSPELSISNTAPTLHGERSAIILEG